MIIFMSMFQFFEPLNPINIEFLKSRDRRPSGECQVYFGSHSEACEAMKYDKKFIGNRYIELFLLSGSMKSTNSSNNSSNNNNNNSNNNSNNNNNNGRQIGSLMNKSKTNTSNKLNNLFSNFDAINTRNYSSGEPSSSIPPTPPPPPPLPPSTNR